MVPPGDVPHLAYEPHSSQIDNHSIHTVLAVHVSHSVRLGVMQVQRLEDLLSGPPYKQRVLVKRGYKRLSAARSRRAAIAAQRPRGTRLHGGASSPGLAEIIRDHLERS